MFEFVVFSIVIAVFIFTIVGVISTLSWLFASKSESDAKPSKKPPKLSADVLASRRLIDHLRSENKLNEKTYAQLRGFLDRNFPEQSEAPYRSQKVDLKPQRESQLAPPVRPPEPKQPVADQTKQPVADQTKKPVPVKDFDVTGRPTHRPSETVVTAELVAERVPTEANQVRPPETEPVGSTDLVAASTTTPAPWDIPDPPPPAPRRSLSELMSGFMQEKNMRWGELTSGILIVLSAVGLVVSLREELRNTIPYFSALLFMLITAAIQGAGIYTLKKWKLRNTSRGSLVIGLLLVPLNFVAACVLSERRELSDPWLWIAVSVGLAAFSAMTWWSSKCLLRRGQLPMTLAIMGCGIGALVLNRTIESAGSSFYYMLFTLPVIASFLVGTCAFDPRQWVRKRWTERASNRMFLFLGVSAFSAIVALSLVLVRADSRMEALVAVAPIASIICIVTSWLSSIVFQSSMRHASGIQVSNTNGVDTDVSGSGMRLASLTLKVFGLILLACSLIVSLSNPSVFVVTALVATIGLFGMFIHQKEEHLIPIAWGVFSSGVLIALNLLVGTFEFDDWASVQQLTTTLVNGKSGICLLLTGLFVGGANQFLKNWIPNLSDPRKFVVRGWIAGGVVVSVGCLIALVASVVHRDSVFDVMVASGLLILAAIVLLVVCVLADRKKIAKAKELPHVASFLLIGALAHSVLWNPTVANWVDSLTGGINAGWIAMIAIHGLALASIGWFLNRKSDSENRGTTSSIFISWSAVSATILVFAALILIPHQTGWATLFELIACLSWLLIGMAWNRDDSNLKSLAAAPFVFVTGMLVSVAIAELVSRTAWCPQVTFPQHWLVQLIGLSAWSITWVVLLNVFRKTSKWRWLESSSAKVDQFVLFGLVLVVGLFVFDTLMPGATQELSKSSSLTSSLGLGDSSAWMVATLVCVALAMLVSLISTPTVSKGAALIGIWFLAWSYGAEPFGDSKSMASALRWLLPIGGVIGAGLIAARRPIMPAWAAMRNTLGLSGKSYWSKSSTQQLINFALAVSAGFVLLISTITVSQVLLNGAGSLGGPGTDSWFSRMPAEISFGVPVALLVVTFLMYAISEQRSWLATVGSAVFQYVVVLAVVLLFLSPHPRLASSWFINILKAVSIGMTGYGFLWYWMRDRIEGQGTTATLASDGGASAKKGWISQIEVHALLNGLLISSLAVLAMGRFYLVPDQPGMWISSVGSLMGVVAWAAFGVLAYCIWRDHTTKRFSLRTMVWLVGWMGLILVGLSSAVVDQFFGQPGDFIAWLPFRVVMIGALIVSLVQTGLIGWFDSVRSKTESNQGEGYVNSDVGKNLQDTLAWPVLLTGSVALAFAVRGAWFHPASFWLYISVLAGLTILIMFVGWMLRAGWLSLVSASIAVLVATIVAWEDPHGWFTGDQPDWFNLIAVLLCCLALGQVVCYVFHRKSEQFPRGFMLMPNIVVLGSAIWIFAAASVQCFLDVLLGSISMLANPLGIVAFVAVAGLVASSLWNDRAKFQVVTACLISVAFALSLASVISTTSEWSYVSAMFAVALMVAAWGVIWLNRAKLFAFTNSLGACSVESLENSMRHQLPIYSLIIGSVALFAALIAIVSFELRPHRYLAAMVPFALAVGLGTQSNQSIRRWLQLLTLLLITVGVLFLAWADLTPDQMVRLPMIRLLVRSLIVLAGAMFVYGGLVTRWVRPGDTWLKSLREMAVVTCGLAVVCLILVIASEASAFVENVGCGLFVGESITVAILVSGMIAGLIIIALRPENDPFALSLQGRMGYVYAAEFVSLALVAHLYFSMPWLFQLGIKDYWPYIMMALCFGGVGIAHVLEKRNLTVLGRPLFNTAAVLPLVVAIAIFGVNSQANLELVMLTVGLAYLMISFTHKSILSAVAAIVFGNLALWMFFRRADFSFFDHPQLWLIPPAVSTLIASQLNRKMLTSSQLSAVRYICVSVIYVSSTMEIFISGIGENLWPPVILAILAVAGIMSGIMFRVKAFLYFGSLFLLMAMITMVAHAHQSLGHVWPWWAFGIGLGIAILVMFGLFEKKKNEMKALGNQLKDWDA